MIGTLRDIWHTFWREGAPKEVPIGTSVSRLGGADENVKKMALCMREYHFEGWRVGSGCLTWSCLDLLGQPWTHLDLFGRNWSHSSSHRLAWNHCLTLSHYVSLGLSLS